MVASRLAAALHRETATCWRSHARSLSSTCSPSPLETRASAQLPAAPADARSPAAMPPTAPLLPPDSALGLPPDSTMPLRATTDARPPAFIARMAPIFKLARRHRDRIAARISAFARRRCSSCSSSEAASCHAATSTSA